MDLEIEPSNIYNLMKKKDFVQSRKLLKILSLSIDYGL